MQPVIQLDLFTRPSPEVIQSIYKLCDENNRINDVRSVGQLIRISPMLINAYQKILL